MRVRFADKKLEALYLEGKGAEDFPQQVVRAFVKAIDFFLACDDERWFYQFKGWQVEKLSGKRKGQRSIRMNDQFRLVYTLEKVEEGKDETKKKVMVTVIVVLELGDYH